MFALHNTTSSGAGHNFQQFCTVSRACHTPTNLQMCRGDRPLGTSSSNSVPQVWMFSSSSTWHSSHTWHSSPWHSSYTWHSTTWPSSYTWHSSPGHSSYTWHSNPWHSSHTWHTNTWHSSCTCTQTTHALKLQSTCSDELASVDKEVMHRLVGAVQAHTVPPVLELLQHCINVGNQQPTRAQKGARVQHIMAP